MRDDGREELAKVLGDHYGTSAGGDDHLWAMADILIERGFGKVREARAAELEAAAVVIDEDQYDCYDPYYAEWLRARAAAIRDGAE